jgi:transcriptional regulator with XRE-family HTH domain
MTKTRRAFSKNLKKIRTEKELTQEELAEKLGISVRYVQLLEGKNTPNVKLDTVEALSKALRIQPADLLKH